MQQWERWLHKLVEPPTTTWTQLPQQRAAAGRAAIRRLRRRRARAKRRRIKIDANKASNDVSEVYSPPRVIEVAEATGLKPGWALDLTVNKDDGKPWDLSLPANKVEALKRQEEEAQELLIASPMCAAFSS